MTRITEQGKRKHEQKAIKNAENTAHIDFAACLSEVNPRLKFRYETEEKKDGPGPVMVSDTLCPAIHILGT